MADWDADSARLRANLARVLDRVRKGAGRHDPITLPAIRQWHAEAMAGLAVPSPESVGHFRGEPGLETCWVGVAPNTGTRPERVRIELGNFMRRLARVTKRLDSLCPVADSLNSDGLVAVIELAAWAHSEWVRIHPFRNGNGRTARILANAVLMRYGLPPVLRLRPRPGASYGQPGAEGMAGNQAPMQRLLRNLLDDVLSGI